MDVSKAPLCSRIPLSQFSQKELWKGIFIRRIASVIAVKTIYFTTESYNTNTPNLSNSSCHPELAEEAIKYKAARNSFLNNRTPLPQFRITFYTKAKRLCSTSVRRGVWYGSAAAY